MQQVARGLGEVERRDVNLREPRERLFRKTEQEINYLKGLFHYPFLFWAKCERSELIIFPRTALCRAS